MKKIVYKVSVILCVLLISTLSVEGALWLFSNKEDTIVIANRRYKKHNERYYTQIPHFSQVYEHPDLFIFHSLKNNSLGFLNNEIEIPKPKNIFRIALMGDSFAESIELPYQYRISAIMQNILRNNVTQDIEVVNCGVRGYGPAQQLIYYKEVVSKIKPDLVILIHCTNDLLDMNKNRIFALKNKQLIPSLNLINGSFPLAQWINDSHINRLIKKFKLSLHSNNNDFDYFLNKKYQHDLFLFSKIMDEFNLATTSNNTQLFIPIITYNVKRFFLHNEGQYKHNQYVSAVSKQLNASGIPHQDLHTYWQEELNYDQFKMSSLFFYHNSHLNEKGSHQVAIDLINLLTKKLDLPWPLITSEHTRFRNNSYYNILPRYHEDHPTSFKQLTTYCAQHLNPVVRDFLFFNPFYLKRLTHTLNESGNLQEKYLYISTDTILKDNLKYLAHYLTGTDWKIFKFTNQSSHPKGTPLEVSENFNHHGYSLAHSSGLKMNMFLHKKENKIVIDLNPATSNNMNGKHMALDQYRFHSLNDYKFINTQGIRFHCKRVSQFKDKYKIDYFYKTNGDIKNSPIEKEEYFNSFINILINVVVNIHLKENSILDISATIFREPDYKEELGEKIKEYSLSIKSNYQDIVFQLDPKKTHHPQRKASIKINEFTYDKFYLKPIYSTIDPQTKKIKEFIKIK